MTNAQPPGQALPVTSPASAAETLAQPIDLRALFTSHAGYVWNALRRLGVQARDLEDLTHDVFLQVQRHLPEYDTTRPVRPWLFAFAFRVASQHRRRMQGRYQPVGDLSEAADPEPLPDERIAAEQNRRLVLAALESIDFERRGVFVLYEIDGVAMTDIADVFGIPVNTAYSRLRVARKEFATAANRLRLRRGGQ